VTIVSVAYHHYSTAKPYRHYRRSLSAAHVVCDLHDAMSMVRNDVDHDERVLLDVDHCIDGGGEMMMLNDVDDDDDVQRLAFAIDFESVIDVATDAHRFYVVYSRHDSFGRDECPFSIVC
jgi:hypothetical protein